MGWSLLLVLSLPLRGFSPGTPVSPSPKSGHRYCFEFSSAGYSYHLEKSGAGHRYCLELLSARYHYHLKISTAGYRYYLEIPRAGYRYCLKDVFNNVARVTTSNKTKSKTINKQCIKKGQNSSTGPHKQTHKITLVLFIVLWGGSILLLSSCLMWIYFVFNTSRAESAFFSNFSLRQWQGNQKDLSFLINTTEQLSVFLFSDFS